MRLSRIQIVLAVAVILFALGGLYVSAAGGMGDPPPLLTNNPLSPQSFATNVARTDAVETADAQLQLDARNGRLGTPAPKAPLTTRAPNPTNVAFMQGAISAADNKYTGLAGDAQYHWNNGWWGIVNHHQLSVEAGSFANNSGAPEAGVLRVAGDAPGLNGLYEPPTPSGPLQLTAVQGTCLTIVSAGKIGYQFDVLARTWSCGQSPTATR